MSIKEKYGQWAMVLGATDGIGKAFAEHFGKNGMDVILIGRREEKLRKLGVQIEKDFGVKTLVIPQDLTDKETSEILIEKVKNLDIGIFNYVATYHKMGSYPHIEYSEIQKVIDININTYAQLLRYFSEEFLKRNRGAIVTMSSLTAMTSSPFNAIYGAAKAFQSILTEGVAREFHDSNVDVIVITAGSTKSPNWFNNRPKGGEEEAMTPEEVVEEGLSMLGTSNSYVVGKENQKSYKEFMCNMTRDEAATVMGSFYEDEYKDK